MSLVVTICATKTYQYALFSQGLLIQANVGHVPGGHIILVTDEAPVTGLLEHYAGLLGDQWHVHHIPLPVEDGHVNYQIDAQLLIAKMRTAAFSKAKALNATECWSLDSDVLPPANALKCMQQMLAFDDGYYGVSTCPYPSQGGGGFLFGRGTIYKQIADDIAEEERDIPPELLEKLKEHRDLQPKNSQPDKEWVDEMRRLEKLVQECRPKGNVFDLNAKTWRKRGWGEMAYPAIGKGAIVPTDWCGFGCTLMGKQALAHADFTGYVGAGTEDLFVVWHKWYPHGIRICSIPHVLCSHVIRNKDKAGYTLCHAYHETEGETAGHIRQRHVPWHDHAARNFPSI